jgi:hypothetical protein
MLPCNELNHISGAINDSECLYDCIGLTGYVQGGKNLVAVVSEWTKCRHVMYLRASASSHGCKQ